jgi:UDP-N-acetylmuramate--alanine ligase
MNDPFELPDLIARLGEPGDLVIFLGAGNITAWAASLPGELARGAAAGAGL